MSASTLGTTLGLAVREMRHVLVVHMVLSLRSLNQHDVASSLVHTLNNWCNNGIVIAPSVGIF